MSPELRNWRKARRHELLARRITVAEDEHAACSRRIDAHLRAAFAWPAGSVIAAYWPFKGEFDPRFVLRHWRDAGALNVLPVVVQKDAPLVFRQWWPGAPMARGTFDLPVPDGTPQLQPDVALIPPIGFDAAGYRLGYGAGYFDRTLAAMAIQPLKIGVAFELSRMATIQPQPHDVAMDFIVTEEGVSAVDAGTLGGPLPPAEVRRRVLRLWSRRGLPGDPPAA